MDSGIFPIVHEVPTHVVYFDSDRAARMFGEEYRVQRLYFWSEGEAVDFASKESLNGGPAVIEAA